MPELAEVESWRKLAEREIQGKVIQSVFTSEDDIVFDQVKPKTFAKKLKGKTVNEILRKGKHLWMDCGTACQPYFHFGMSGSFYVYTDTAERSKWVKAELLMEDGTRLAYQNKRRIGKVRFHDDATAVPPISKLGFDPYLDMPAISVFREKLGKRKSPIKSVLLDQAFAAGVGNWIADEILYQGKIHPKTHACDLSNAQIKLVKSKMKSIIDLAVRVDADDSKFPKSWLFHSRWGKNSEATTHDGKRIEFLTIGGRTTAYVPELQKA